MSLKPPLNKNNALNEWKQEALFLQDRISYHCSKKRWDKLEYSSQYDDLFHKISGALFGPIDEGQKYPEEHKKIVLNIISKMKKHSCSHYSCYMAVIYIFVFTHDCQTGCIPVFRVAQYDRLLNGQISPEMSKFIDNSGRVYNSWDHFLKTNTIERSHICVPVNGYYSGNDDYQFIDMSSKGLAVRGIDIASTVTSVGSCVGMLGGAALTLFPPTAPIGAAIVTSSIVAGVPGGVWSAGRSIRGLVDRGKHEESIKLSDGEARKHWLMCTTSILSLGTFGVAKGIAIGAQAGKTIPTAVINVCKGLQVTTAGVSAVGITDQIYQISKQKEVSTLDILNLTTQLLVLTHTTVQFMTAKAIVQEAQNQKTSSFKRFLGLDNQNVIQRANTTKFSCPVAGKQEMIRTLKEVDINTYLTSSLPNSNPVSSEIVSLPARSNNILQDFKMIMDKVNTVSSSIIKPENLNYLVMIHRIIKLFKTDSFFKDLDATIDTIKDILTEKQNGAVKFRSFDKIVQKCTEYFEERIKQMRSENPNPNTNGKNVKNHYKHEINSDIKSNKDHDFKTYLTNLIDNSQDDPFALSCFDKDKCDDIIDDIEGCVVPDTTKHWERLRGELDDEDILKCSFQTENCQNIISFFNCGNDLMLVHNEKSDTYQKSGLWSKLTSVFL